MSDLFFGGTVPAGLGLATACPTVLAAETIGWLLSSTRQEQKTRAEKTREERVLPELIDDMLHTN
ncbi:MAG: hypothetical protein HY318_08175 [Armatimonadetes bacterium]|nr:hypothetical protein [Armatimonadota bacterium]